jgi:uncharacterized protein (UPF0264 family)
MTKLLISVRSAAEAGAAVESGADVVDVKEPARGALGALDPQTIREIADRVQGRVPLSVALGELLCENVLTGAMIDSLRNAQYAKFGLAGCGSDRRWIDRLHEQIGRLPSDVTPVAVAYADWTRAKAPEPRDVLSAARGLGCGVLLIDTYEKSGGTLIDQLGFDDLSDLARAAQRAGLLCALAGGLRERDIGKILPLSPDFVAMRGGVCHRGRTGSLDPERVGRIAALVHSADAVAQDAHRSDVEIRRTRSGISQ